MPKSTGERLQEGVPRFVTQRIVDVPKSGHVEQRGEEALAAQCTVVDLLHELAESEDAGECVVGRCLLQLLEEGAALERIADMGA